MPVTHGATVKLSEQAIVVHEVKRVLVVAQSVQGTLANSLDEPHEGMRNIPEWHVSHYGFAPAGVLAYC